MIYVCSLNDVESICLTVKPKYLISVIDPGYAPETPKGVLKHLKLGFDDIIEVNDSNHIFRDNINEIPQIPPNKNHLNSIINFTNEWQTDEDIVIHCWCGVSRSMATATYLLCKSDKTDIDRNIRYIRSIASHANPNKLMISLFEHYLNLNNKITEAYKKYPHTNVYDCSSNFAPITLFNAIEMKEFK
tara:strand:+ start:5144 stop:5707 length:564 start_codon:yes stop_codon:yes gene_type:complete